MQLHAIIKSSMCKIGAVSKDSGMIIVKSLEKHSSHLDDLNSIFIPQIQSILTLLSPIRVKMMGLIWI